MMQKAEQINLFGAVVAAAVAVPKLKKNKFLTMQQMHGTNEASICRDCACLVKMKYGRVVYKCMRWKFTPDSESDINEMQAACGKFVPY